jgi:prepilin peptidase CpaA
MRIFGNAYLLATLYFGVRISLSDVSARVVPNIDLIPILLLQTFHGVTSIGVLFLASIYAVGLFGFTLIGAGDLKLLGILSLGLSYAWQFEFLIFVAFFVGLLWSIANLLNTYGSKRRALSVPFAPAIFIGYLAVWGV